jgi:hypothetical protein
MLNSSATLLACHSHMWLVAIELSSADKEHFHCHGKSDWTALLQSSSQWNTTENHGARLVAHAYNPSYLGGRDQEDYGSRSS